MITEKQLCLGFPHHPSNIGGPGSFQTRISKALEKRGWKIVYPEDNVLPDVILVVGGTRKLSWLRKCKKKGTKIVHRLDGLFWQHRVSSYSLKTKIVSEIYNWLSRTIRNIFADTVIYQSQFIRDCWHRQYGKASCEETVIHNAVSLSEFCPGSDSQDNSLPKLLCIEGSIHSSPAYTEPLIFLTKRLYDLGLISGSVVYGCIEQEGYNKLSSIATIELAGAIPREQIPHVLRNAVFLVLEVNPPCPNSVIEALASGIPVIGFDTGALRELVSPEAGIVVPYGGDPWKLHTPDVSRLEAAALQVLAKWDEFSSGARQLAEDRYSLDEMVDKYLTALSDN